MGLREKQLRLLLTFHTTTAAMAMERACRDSGAPGRLIPVPRSITAGCGMSWSAPTETRAELRRLTEEKSIPVAGEYELWL